VAYSFAGTVAVVTGASSGIGWELARQLAAAGAKVGLVARRREPLDQLTRVIADTGGTAVVAPGDVADRTSLELAVAAVRNALGPIDLMVANAGVGMPTRLDPVNVADVEAMIRVNVLGMVYAFAAVMPEMLRRRSGRLVAVSSLAGFGVLPGESAYCASKAAVNVYLDGLRAHLRGTGVTVTTLCPGFVKTPMTAENKFWMPGLMSAEEAARRMLGAVARGTKVYRFPWVTSFLTRLASNLPDWAKVKLMADYNEEAANDKASRER
jgi:short-subunit dehydrogenase